MDFLKEFNEFLDEGIFSGMDIVPGKTFVVKKKLEAENRNNGELYYFKPGEVIEDIQGIEKGYVIFNKKDADNNITTYAIRKKSFEKGVTAQVEFPRKTIINNLAEMMAIMKNLKNETTFKDRKDLAKRLSKALSKKSNDEIKTLMDSLYNFNITFSKFES